MATRSKTRRSTTRRTTRRTTVRKTHTRAPRKIVARRQPETLRLRSIVPSYTVNDLEASIAWYCEGLGFMVKERWEEKGRLMGVMLAAGACELALSQDDFAKGRDRVKGVGYRIHAETAQSVDALAERIRAYGGKIVTEPSDTPWGTRAFTVEDLDGFRISFEQPRKG